MLSEYTRPRKDLQGSYETNVLKLAKDRLFQTTATAQGNAASPTLVLAAARAGE